jgi:peptidoglycan-N-acetylglucosamine deacetylase
MTTRPFSWPGDQRCNTTLGRGDAEISMDAMLRERFVAARGPFSKQIALPADGINLMQVGHFEGDGKSFDAIRAEIERARALGGWIVWMTHGVGENTHDLHMDLIEHEKLIRWLGANRDTIWTAPLVEVAKYVKEQHDTPIN